MSPTSKPSSPKAVAILLVFIVLLGLTGIGLAAELTYIHSNTHQNPEFHSLCAISEGMNCETVALSPYSVFLNLPVSVWGLIGYILIASLGLISLVRMKKVGPMFGAVFGFCTVAFLSSAVLAYVSFTKIDSLCLFCMGTYMVNTALLILSIVLLIKGPKNPVAAVLNDLRALIKAPGYLGVILIVGVSPIVVAYASIQPYWKTVGFDEIAKLPNGIDENKFHWTGATHPKVTIIEYTDYECPYCRTAHKQLRELVAKYSNDVRVIHRHFPLDQKCNPRIRQKFHQHACDFSTAAECAAREGKFWEMNDAIFSSQDTQKAESIDVEKFAIQLGIDRSEFSQCLKDESIQKEILRNINAGISDGVSATPTFVVNGQKFTGRLSEEQLLMLIKIAE